MSLPVLLLAFSSTVPNISALSTFHQLRLLATSSAFDNLVLLLVRQQIYELLKDHNVLINEFLVLFAQIMRFARHASVHEFFHRIAIDNVAHSRFRHQLFFRLRIDESFLKVRKNTANSQLKNGKRPKSFRKWQQQPFPNRSLRPAD